MEGFQVASSAFCARSFLSREDLLAALKEASINHGFCISSDRGKRTIKFCCDRGPKYRQTISESLERNTGTRKIDCVFKISARETNDKGVTSLAWSISSSHHNHTSARHMNDEEKKCVVSVRSSGSKPLQILTTLWLTAQGQTAVITYFEKGTQKFCSHSKRH